MEQKKYQVRVQNKRDTHANLEQSDFVPLDAELIIVDMEQDTVNFKVGNGVSTYKDLPFVLPTSPSGNEEDEEQGGQGGDSSDTVVGGSKEISCVLAAENWEEQMQSIPVEGVTVTHNGVIAIDPAYTEEQYEALCSAELSLLEQSEGFLKIVASGIVPTIDIPLVLILLS